MIRQDEPERDLAALVVPLWGCLDETGDPWEPYRLVDPAGGSVAAVGCYLRHLQAVGRAAATQRSYGMDLLRWFRFLWAIETGWDRATRIEARDFTRWLLIAGKPVRSHWRRQRPGSSVTGADSLDTASVVIGRPPAGGGYSSATRAHNETVLRHFYDFHLDAGGGPLVNPFPLARGRGGQRVHAHHNPMDSYQPQQSGLYRPRLPQRVPRHVPDEKFNELFAALSCHRDRALVAFWISTGARASELLGARRGDADPGQQLITVVRKGTRVLQQLPASPDAFVWLRLYQAELADLVPTGRDEPL